jgi:peptidoglycan/LPS O-acetylase OafA/YrhL
MVLGLVVVVIYSCARRELVTPVWWLNARPLRRLGDWSFALYMVHPLVLRVFASALGQKGSAFPRCRPRPLSCSAWGWRPSSASSSSARSSA